MATSGKGQLALLAVGAALLAGTIAVFGLPPRERGQVTAPLSATAPQPLATTEPATPAPLSDNAPEIAPKVAPNTLPDIAAVTPQQNVPASAPAGGDEAQAEAAAPAFDIVRVGPGGDSVVAGRATPGKVLELLVDGQVHDRSEVRESGSFALTPPALAPGDHELTLREVAPDGSTSLSRQSVTVVLAPDRAAPPVVALAEPDRPTVLLSDGGVVARELAGLKDAGATTAMPPRGADVAQAPARQEPASAPTSTSTSTPAPGKVRIATVEAEEGRLFVSGNAPPGAAVRLYLNDSFIAQGQASAGGGLSFSLHSGVAAGDYQVRLDEVEPGDGQVVSRAEVPFVMREEQLAAAEVPPAAGSGDEAASAQTGDGSHVVVPEVRTVRVERGDSLWRISRRIYGRGPRYTVIYDANQNQIRSPHRIYPGQVFVLPSESGTDGAEGSR